MKQNKLNKHLLSPNIRLSEEEINKHNPFEIAKILKDEIMLLTEYVRQADKIKANIILII